MVPIEDESEAGRTKRENARLRNTVKMHERSAEKREKRILELEAEVIRVRTALQKMLEKLIAAELAKFKIMMTEVKKIADEALKTKAGLYIIKNQGRVH